MKWKPILASVLLVIIFLIVAFPYLSGFNVDLQSPFSFSGLFYYLFPEEDGTKFGISLIANAEAFKNQEFEIINSSLSSQATCYLPLGSGDIAGSCKIFAPRVNGKLYLSNDYEIVLEPTSLNINSLNLVFDGGSLVLRDVEKLSITKVKSDEIILTNAFGQINHTGTQAIQPLKGKNVVIKNYEGIFLKINESIKLIGFASSVEGDNFVWKG